jgi:ERCC4-type nuclease
MATIVVDVHERSSGIPTLLRELGIDVEVGRLPAGDYLVSRTRVVERKRILDLHVSIRRGRFWPQLGALRDSADVAYLLVEGTELDRGPLRPGSALAVCLAVLDLEVRLLRSAHQRESALWLARLALRYQSRRRRPVRPAYAQRPKARSQREASEAMLAAIPGLSAVSARALLDRFGSVPAALAAGTEAWLAVPGIGPRRAAALERMSNPSRLRREGPGRAT